MQDKDILSLVGDALTEKSNDVEIDIKPKNWLHKLLMKKGFMESKLVFKITPILVGNRYRVSSIAVKLPKDTFEDGKLNLIKAWEAIQQHTDDFIYVVAICIQNDEHEPSNHLLNMLRWLPDDKFFTILDKSLSQAGIASFMNSIILINGRSVLNVQEKDATPVTDQG